MKLKNKETGKYVSLDFVNGNREVLVSTGSGYKYYKTLKDLTNEWEDWEETQEKAKSGME